MVSNDSHCCQELRDAVKFTCDEHPERFDCPDALVHYTEKFDEYGLIIHDGGTSCISIRFCPWCGSPLPESKRDRWFDELAYKGVDPGGAAVPHEYETDEWWRRGLADGVR